MKSKCHLKHHMLHFFYNHAAPMLYVRVGILLTCRKHVHDLIISLRIGHIRLVYPRHFSLKCLYQTRKVCGRVFCRARGIDFASLFDFDIWFWNVRTMWYFFFILLFWYTVSYWLQIKISPLKLWVRNPVNDYVYSIKHYVIKFVNDLRKICGFLRLPRFPPPIQLRVKI